MTEQELTAIARLFVMRDTEFYSLAKLLIQKGFISADEFEAAALGDLDDDMTTFQANVPYYRKMIRVMTGNKEAKA